MHVSQSLAIIQGVVYGNRSTVQVKNLCVQILFFYSAFDNSFVFKTAKITLSVNKYTNRDAGRIIILLSSQFSQITKRFSLRFLAMHIVCV